MRPPAPPRVEPTPPGHLVRRMERDPALPERERLARRRHRDRRRAAVGELDARPERPARLRSRRDVHLVARGGRPAQHRRAARPARQRQPFRGLARAPAAAPPTKTSSGPPSSLRSTGLTHATIGPPAAGKAATTVGPAFTPFPPRASTPGAGSAWPATPVEARSVAARARTPKTLLV